MKTIVGILVLVSSTAFAGDVKVTSFRFLDHSAHFSPGAELCGEVVIPSGKPTMIKITSDPTEKSPGNYYAWTGGDGKFCSIIATYTGKAEVGLASESGTTPAEIRK